MKVSDLPLTPPKILIWGKPGCGKTPFLTSYGEGLQIIDCDRGMLSSRTLDDKWKKDRLNVDIVDCFESDPTSAKAWALTKKTVTDIYTSCVRKTYPFEVLAIDSFTTLAENCLRSIMYNSNKLGQTPQLQNWGGAISEIENLFVYLVALPIPVVVTFHDREASIGKGDSEETFEEIAIFGRNLPRTITGKFDELWRQKVRTVSGKMQPYLQTEPENRVLVRSRGKLKDGTLTDVGLRSVLKDLGWTPPPSPPPKL